MVTIISHLGYFMQAKTDRQGDSSKQSVLQWAGSSLKTMGKKLRKPLHLEPEAQSAAKQAQQSPASPGSVTPRPYTASKPLAPLPGVYTPAVRQLQIQVPPMEAAYGDLQAEVTHDLPPFETELTQLTLPQSILSLIFLQCSSQVICSRNCLKYTTFIQNTAHMLLGSLRLTLSGQRLNC